MYSDHVEPMAEGERSPSDHNQEVMHLSCVAFTYYGETNAVLRCCSGVVWEGAVLVISGANGSGKSTLCRLLASVMNPDAGNLQGEVKRMQPRRNTASLEPECLPESSFNSPPSSYTPESFIGYIGGEAIEQFVIGIVEDELAFGPENLGLKREEISHRVERELIAMDMEKHRYSHVEQLSGGQQQRVAAAAVWTMEPDMLVVDDAWNALDTVGRKLFTDALYRWHSGEAEGCRNEPDEAEFPLGRRRRTLIVATSRLSELDHTHPLWANAEHWSLEEGQLIQKGKLNTKPAQKHEAYVCKQELGPLLPSAYQLNQQAVLRLEQLHVQYRDGYKVLQDVNAQLQAGEGVVLGGSNGSGKSSLLKVLSGAIMPYKGHIKIQGTERRKLRASELAKRIGYVSQRATNMFIASRVIDECKDQYEQLGLQPNEHGGAEAWSLQQLEAIGLQEQAYLHPHDLSLSAQRMLSLWLATIHQPSLILLDEPTAGLDERSALEVITWCNQERMRGAAVIAATHDPLWLSNQSWTQWITEQGTIRCE